MRCNAVIRAKRPVPAGAAGAYDELGNPIVAPACWSEEIRALVRLAFSRGNNGQRSRSYDIMVELPTWPYCTDELRICRAGHPAEVCRINGIEYLSSVGRIHITAE